MRAERLGSYSTVAEHRRHVVLVALEVDPPVVALLAAAAVTHGHAALAVAAADAQLVLDQRLVRRVGGDLLEGRARLETAAGGGWLVAAQRHPYTPSKNSIFWPAAR